MAGVFISYRRQDVQSAAGRLADSLERRFGKAQIFRDIETIQPGVDFVEAIEGALSSCSAMLVVIGPRWANCVDEASRPRLKNANDWIRIEIATALKRGIRVIPVLVEGAPPPDEADLPDDLKPLARRQALSVADERWEYDVGQLAAALESVGVHAAPVQPSPSRAVPTHAPLLGGMPEPARQPIAKPAGSKLMKTLAWIGGFFVLIVVIGMLSQCSSNDGPGQHSGLPSGAATGPCGCWGFVTLGASQPNPQCASGFHTAVACPGACPLGGAPWQTRCI